MALTGVDKLKLACGSTILAVLLPFVAIVVGSSVLWDAIDPITMRVARMLNTKLHDRNKHMVKNEKDSFFINAVVYFAAVIPAFFAFHLVYTIKYGFSWYMAYAYNLIRIGPYFMGFAYVYVLCHKEGHSHKGMFKEPYNKYLRNIFNFWVGLFYGVLPSTFFYGHSKNHHQYNNEEQDIITTGDKPRDSFLNYVMYMPRFFLYAVNISTVQQFYKEKNYPYVTKMIMGSLVYLAFLGACMYINVAFAFAYVLYPLFENVVLLSAINWCWHAFLDPKDPHNDYVSSITIFNGLVNVMEEDYHVVHHQYPGAHWSKHPELLKKHEEEYKKEQATIFEKTHAFEMFFLIILRKYKEMAEKFVDPSGKLTMDQKEELIKARLRACNWGPLAATTEATKAQ